MPFVRSAGAILELSTAWAPTAAYGSVSLYDSRYHAYSTIYRTQPNVRTCVDFLARNVAQLGLHVFRLMADGDRQRLRDHPLAQLIARPNPWTTAYRLIEGLMGDLGVYHNAFWLKMQRPDGIGLLQVPPRYVTVEGDLVATRYVIDLGARREQVDPSAMVHFRGYNPLSSLVGLSPMETLRRVLAEEQAMGEYREHFWQNGARMYGIVQRPPQKDIGGKEWSDAARERFREQFEALYSGATNSGRTAVLEDGMTWQEMSFDAQEAEYLGARKLTREECARAYHIPLPMVGILDHATFSNIREQHKNLYQDSLGPWLAMIEQDIELQLLPDLGDTDGVYCEFNIAEKLAGSFEEQTAALQAAVGRPWMTPDEARARLNLPRLGGDASELATPLNVLVGGQANPQESAPPAAGEAAARPRTKSQGARAEARYIVAGPPCAGKSTYVREHMSAGQLVYDYDTVHQALSGQGSHVHLAGIRPYVLAARDAVLGKLMADTPEQAAWVITSTSRTAEIRRLATQLRATVILLAVDREEAHRRCDADKRPKEWHDYIDRWFDSSDIDRADWEAKGACCDHGAKARRGQLDPTHPELRERYEEQHRRLMARAFERQRDAIIGKVPEGEGPQDGPAGVDEIWDAARWNREIGNDLRRLGLLTATAWGESVTEELDVEFDADRMDEWIAQNSRIAAEEINKATRNGLAAALLDEAPRVAVGALFAAAISARAPEIAVSRVTTLSVFGANEGARQGGLKTKTWQVNSANPRPEHASMDGETVNIDEYFSNGMRWPGDPMGGAENNSNCKCSLTFGR